MPWCFPLNIESFNGFPNSGLMDSKCSADLVLGHRLIHAPQLLGGHTFNKGNVHRRVWRNDRVLLAISYSGARPARFIPSVVCGGVFGRPFMSVFARSLICSHCFVTITPARSERVYPARRAFRWRNEGESFRPPNLLFQRVTETTATRAMLAELLAIASPARPPAAMSAPDRPAGHRCSRCRDRAPRARF